MVLSSELRHLGLEWSPDVLTVVTWKAIGVLYLWAFLKWPIPKRPRGTRVASVGRAMSLLLILDKIQVIATVAKHCRCCFLICYVLYWNIIQCIQQNQKRCVRRKDFTPQKAWFIRLSYTSMRLNAHWCVEMMGLIGAGNNPMVGMTIAVAVAIEEASK